jgi:polyhydroxyalkanoate synthesis regulator phasin
MGRDNKRAAPEAWRTYLELAMGVTEASRKRAGKVAKDLMGRTNATAEQVQSFAEDLLSTSLANREAISKLVRFELDRALGLVGLATVEEVAELTRRVRELEAELREAKLVSGELDPAVLHNGHDVGAAARTMTDMAAAKPAPPKKTAKKAVKKAVPGKAAPQKAAKKAAKAAKKAGGA